MHLLRLLVSSDGTLREGRIPVRVNAERGRLLAVKRSELSWDEAEAIKTEREVSGEHT
jgi:uncharacterized protein